jgi:hypothetical protein
MLLKSLVSSVLASCLLLNVDALAMSGRASHYVKPYKRAALQDIVTFDSHSLFVNNERVMIYSGEFHPYRVRPDLLLEYDTPTVLLIKV